MTAFVGWGEVVFVVAVGSGDDFCSGESSAVFGSLVAAWEGVGICSVLGGVVAAVCGAVGSVDGVEEVVEGGAFYCVSYLVSGIATLGVLGLR